MDNVEAILHEVQQALKDAPGIVGVVLGGSRATGTHRPDSDVDIGIYYEADKLDLAALDRAATALDQEHREGLIAPPGSWGNWVNGGGWLIIGDLHVDLILRDIARVQQAIADCREGRVTAHYQPGHPHAYLNAMYMGELAACRILHDPTGTLQTLQAQTRPYPAKMKQAILGFYLFEAGFSQELAAKNADKGDPYYVAAHVVRSISALNQVLFALNETYCLNEKRAVQRIDSFQHRPADYMCKVEEIFATLGSDPARACRMLGELVEDVRGQST